MRRQIFYKKQRFGKWRRDDGKSNVLISKEAMVDAYLGKISLSLTGEQTRQLVDHPSSKDGKFTGVWDIQWTPAGLQPRTLCQGKVECVADVTR